MSEHAIEFLQEWIGEKVQAPTNPEPIEQQAETLAKECAAKAAEAGIPLEDIQEEVGDIQDLIAAKLEDAADKASSDIPPADNENQPSGTDRKP